MKTLNRQTASEVPTPTGAPTRADLAELQRGIRRLWARDLRADPEEREALLIELTEVDLAVERLSLRASCNIQLSDDALIASRCAERLAEFEHRWDLDHSAGPSPRQAAA